MYSRNSEEIKKRITEGWKQILSSNFSNLSEKISGGSPPSVFVSSYAYPKVKVGPLFSPLQTNSAILDHPEKWAGKAIEEIIRYKLALIRGTYSTHVKTNLNSDRFIQSLQELTMATKSTQIEVAFERKPKLNLEEFALKTTSDSDTIHFGMASELEGLKLPSDISTDKKIEKAFYDNDFKAIEAINYLYKEGIEISKISKILSLGMIGIQKNRRLVPSKWSISAIDQIISSNLIKKTNTFRPLDGIKIYKYMHLGNYYSIILIHSFFDIVKLLHAHDSALARVSNLVPLILKASLMPSLICHTPTGRIYSGCISLRTITDAFLFWLCRNSITASLAAKYDPPIFG